jgi:hypothetical protein
MHNFVANCSEMYVTEYPQALASLASEPRASRAERTPPLARLSARSLARWLMSRANTLARSAQHGRLARLGEPARLNANPGHGVCPVLGTRSYHNDAAMLHLAEEAVTNLGRSPSGHKKQSPFLYISSSHHTLEMDSSCKSP